MGVLRDRHTVGVIEAPAGAGGPGGLSEAFDPNAAVGQIRSTEREHGLIGVSDLGAVEAEDQVQGQGDAQGEQSRDGDFADLFHGLADAAGHDRGADDHVDGMEQNDLTGMSTEIVPGRLQHVDGHVSLVGAGSGVNEVLDAVTDDNGIIRCQEHQDNGAGHAQPGIFGSHEIAEAAGVTHTGLMSHNAFGHQQRERPQEQADQPGEDEGAAAIGCDHAGETPNVTTADGHAQSCKNEAQRATETRFAFSHEATSLL